MSPLRAHHLGGLPRPSPSRIDRARPSTAQQGSVVGRPCAAAVIPFLDEAATPGAETHTDALLLLMIVDHREGRPGDAMKRLAVLERAHPLNRLLLLNHAASALAAKQPQAADEMLSKGIGN